MVPENKVNQSNSPLMRSLLLQPFQGLEYNMTQQVSKPGLREGCFSTLRKVTLIQHLAKQFSLGKRLFWVGILVQSSLREYFIIIIWLGQYSLYCNSPAIPLETNNYNFVYDSLDCQQLTNISAIVSDLVFVINNVLKYIQR